MLWAATVRRVPLSGVLVDDCEAYEDFLQTPAAGFIGARAPCHSPRWRPFADGQLSDASRRYAVRALRAAFAKLMEWLVDVRYLAGNPWTGRHGSAGRDAGARPAGGTRPARRALAPDSGSRHAPGARRRRRSRRGAMAGRARGDVADGRIRAASQGAGWHRARGAANSPHSLPDQPVWQLTIVGKRRKERTVPVSVETVDALRALARSGDGFRRAGCRGRAGVAGAGSPTHHAWRSKHAGDTCQPYSADAGRGVLRDAASRARRN